MLCCSLGSLLLLFLLLLLFRLFWFWFPLAMGVLAHSSLALKSGQYIASARMPSRPGRQLISCLAMSSSSVSVDLDLIIVMGLSWEI